MEQPDYIGFIQKTLDVKFTGDEHNYDEVMTFVSMYLPEAVRVSNELKQL